METEIQDCQITLRIEKGQVRAEMKDMSMASFAQLIGAMQVMYGMMAHRLGASLDEIKDGTLELWDEAMWDLKRSINREEGKADGTERNTDL